MINAHFLSFSRWIFRGFDFWVWFTDSKIFILIFLLLFSEGLAFLLAFAAYKVLAEFLNEVVFRLEVD